MWGWAIAFGLRFGSASCFIPHGLGVGQWQFAVAFFFGRVHAIVEPHPNDAGWSSPVAREAHNLEVAGSNPVPAISRPHCPPWPVRPFFARLRAAFTAALPSMASAAFFCAAPCRVHGRTALHGQCGLFLRGSVPRSRRQGHQWLLPAVFLAASRGYHCGRQDRGPTPVGFRSVPVVGSRGRVFAGAELASRSDDVND
jgi:hypothetical protein